MRGTTKKLITEWGTKSWLATSAEEQKGFKDVNDYIEKLKTLWKTDKRFQEFIHSTIQQF